MATVSEWPSLIDRRGQMYPTGWVRVFRPGAPDSTPHNVGTGYGRGAIAVGREAVWVTNGWSRTVARLDRRDLKVSAVVKVRRPPVSVAVGPQATWVLCGNGWLWRVSTGAEAVEGVARLGARARAVAATDRWVWALRERGDLSRIEPSSGEVTLQTSVGRGARHLLEAEGALWATRRRGRRVLRIDGDSGEPVAESKPPRQAACLAVDGGTVWICCRRRFSGDKGWLYRGDASTLEWDESLVLDGRPRAIACGMDAVWIASAARGERAGLIARFDPRDGSLETVAETDWPVYELAVCGDSLLATMGLAVTSTFDAGSGPFDLGAGGGGGGDGGGSS
jgi:hypothetical protein